MSSSSDAGGRSRRPPANWATVAKMNVVLSPCVKSTLYGTSFDPLTQEHVCLALSHLNSYPRESLGWRTPYDVFVERHGDEGKVFLAKLGIVRIPANQVTAIGKYAPVRDAGALYQNPAGTDAESRQSAFSAS